MDKTNLIKRGHVWCARVAIPRHLQDTLNKREIVRSLRTTSLAEANRLKHAVIAEIRKLIADAEQATGGRASNSPTDKLLADLRALRRERRMKLLPSGDVEQMRDHYADRAHDLDDSGKVPDDATRLALRTALSAVDDDSLVILSEAIDAYLKEDEERLRPSTIRQRRKSLEDFRAWRGDCELDAVLRPEAGRYVADVLIPKKRAPDTTKHTLGDLSGFWNWACGRGISANNPFDRMARTIKMPTRGVRKDVDKELRSWTQDELVKLVTETDLKSDLWVMSVLALYTGCRENELAEMRCEDVYDTYLYIPESKTTAGRRLVPIHPVIKPLVAHLKETSTDDYLVSSLKRGGYDKKRHHMFAKRFSYHKTKRLKLPAAVVFHGLRKNLVTSLHNQGVVQDRIQQIIGHEHGSLALDVYSDGIELKRLAKDVKKVTFGKQVDTLVSARIKELTKGKAEG